MKKILFLFLVLVQSQVSIVYSRSVCKPLVEDDSSNTFSLDEWVVTGKSMGPITLGSTFQDIIPHLKYFQKQMIPCYEVGIDGEELIDVYFLDGEKAFMMKFDLQSKKLASITIMHKDLKTAQGIGTNSTAADILRVCPDTQFELFMMTGTDMCKSEKCGLSFDFDDLVCDYEPGNEVNGKPKRTSLKPIRMYINM